MVDAGSAQRLDVAETTRAIIRRSAAASALMENSAVDEHGKRDKSEALVIGSILRCLSVCPSFRYNYDTFECAREKKKNHGRPWMTVGLNGRPL